MGRPHRTNHHLTRFYSRLRRRWSQNFHHNCTLYGPDLIWLTDEYLNSSPRIALIGQQVLTWDYTCQEFYSGKVTVREAIANYRQFNFAEDDHQYHNSPFWQFYRRISTSAFPGEQYIPGRVLWTNLVKFVARGGMSLLEKPFTQAEAAIQCQEDILRTELAIAKPHICLFVTGPNFDCLLCRYYPGLTFHPLANSVHVHRLAHIDLPSRSFRTYHPNYLSRQKQFDRTITLLNRVLNW